jgi:hypothetical protein
MRTFFLVAAAAIITIIYLFNVLNQISKTTSPGWRHQQLRG